MIFTTIPATNLDGGHVIVREVPGRARAIIAVISPDEAAGFDHVEAAHYTHAMRDCLQQLFGTPEAPTGEALGEFAGHAIPPALAEVAHLLQQAEGKEPYQRTPEQNRAVIRFIEYCDAEGIELTPLYDPETGAQAMPPEEQGEP